MTKEDLEVAAQEAACGWYNEFLAIHFFKLGAGHRELGFPSPDDAVHFFKEGFKYADGKIINHKVTGND